MRCRTRHRAASAEDELAVLMQSRERVARQIHSQTLRPDYRRVVVLSDQTIVSIDTFVWDVATARACIVARISVEVAMTRAQKSGVVFAAFMMMAPAVTFAQTSAGSIAGIVKDTTGAVLQGVTVEASSPALIEKVRTVVTDGEGRYQVIGLRPGVYTVAF